MPATKPRAVPRKEPRWATVGEAAEYTRLAPRTIYKRIADGILPAYVPRGSRVLRIDLNDLDAMIRAGGRIASAHLGDGRPAARPRARKGDGHAA
jgi:excisionase family DNA binding protein